MAVPTQPERREDITQEFTDIIGGHGPWQLGMFTFFFFCAAPHCMHNLIMTFFAPNVDHWCSRPAEVLAANVSVEQWKNWSIPQEIREGKPQSSQCQMVDESFNQSVIKFRNISGDNINIVTCNSWEYDLSFYQSTLVDEWDLVCDREWMVSIAKTIYMVGFLVSVVISGQVSDRFGRRPVVLLCLGIFLIAAFLTLLSKNFIMFIVLRFFVALGLTSVFTVSYVILTEVISAEYRSVYCFMFKLGWVFAYMALPGIAWLIPSWFWLQFAITLPWVTLLCAWWVVPETPRWLLTHSRFDEAEEVLMIAARKNKRDMQQAKAAIKDLIRHAAKGEDKERNETIFDLLRSPTLRKYTVNIYFCWFIISYIYYALSWNTNDLGGDPYLTFFICGAVELPSTILFMFISKAIGHRIALLISNVAAGICLLLLVPIPNDMTWLKITVSMAGKFFNAASFDTVYVYSAEIFPTVVRNVGVGSSSTWARVGALTAPFIKQWGDITHPVVPVAVPGALSIISGFLLLLLPETKGKKIPDTLEEGELFGWRSTCPTQTTNGIKLEERNDHCEKKLLAAL